MNAQQLEYIRIQLRAALVDDSGGTKGQLEAFAEHPPADKNLNPRKHIHAVELDNGRGGVRRVKAENSALYVLETRSRRLPMPPLREAAFSTCAWRRAIYKLNVSEQAWVKYCYGHNMDFKLQIIICQEVWRRFLNKNIGMKFQARVEKKILQLVWLAVQDVASKNRNDTYKEYAGIMLANMLSVNRSTWYRIYSSNWSCLKEIVSAFDTKILSSLFN
ncbi:bacteriophage antitermination protein Q [Enterobacter roggenkampii]|uniref:bacteriophage antitermination protein Q n=1 Tax=Enterobacter roggenkampii TaxID=1812935 RepID=UPI0021D1BB4C|nr:bacteriophage antitermination protein Q [Enterobacter roggenkampii]MCU6164899.1 bacteriophage antitermination protein Q [Enterobacter roggenkampii]